VGVVDDDEQVAVGHEVDQEPVHLSTHPQGVGSGLPPRLERGVGQPGPQRGRFCLVGPREAHRGVEEVEEHGEAEQLLAGASAQADDEPPLTGDVASHRGDQ